MQVKNINLIGLEENVFKFLYVSDIYLSRSLYEGIPFSILEEISIGLLIVASNVFGNIDTVNDSKTGYLYDLNNIGIAIKYIKKLAMMNPL